MGVSIFRKVLIVVAALGILVGLGLIFKPAWMQRVSRIGNTWITLRRATRAFDKPITVDSWLIRHGRTVGTVVVLAGIYILVRLFY
jgi:hypothetical protein